jgi:hypothetical protein
MERSFFSEKPFSAVGTAVKAPDSERTLSRLKRGGGGRLHSAVWGGGGGGGGVGGPAYADDTPEPEDG